MRLYNMEFIVTPVRDNLSFAVAGWFYTLEDAMAWAEDYAIDIMNKKRGVYITVRTQLCNGCAHDNISAMCRCSRIGNWHRDNYISFDDYCRMIEPYGGCV